MYLLDGVVNCACSHSHLSTHILKASMAFLTVPTFSALKNLYMKCFWSIWPCHIVNLCFVFSAIVGNSAATLLTTIEEMHLLSKKIFFNSLSLHASKLMDKVCFKMMQLSCFQSHVFIFLLSGKIIRWMAALDFNFS